jgi:hypothetical protein
MPARIAGGGRQRAHPRDRPMDEAHHERARALDGALDARLPAVERFDAYYEGEQRSRSRRASGARRSARCSTSSPTTGASWSSTRASSVSRSRASASGPRATTPTTRRGSCGRPTTSTPTRRSRTPTRARRGSRTCSCSPGRPRDAAHHGRVARAGDRADAPDDRRKRLAALKRWREDDGTSRACSTRPTLLPLRALKHARRGRRRPDVPTRSASCPSCRCSTRRRRSATASATYSP